LIARILIVVVIGVCLAAGFWHYRSRQQTQLATGAPVEKVEGDAWLILLYSRNPREVEAASQQVMELGPRAVPVIQTTLRDPQAEAERLKGALKACGILGRTAALAIPDVAEVLLEPGLTAEAAIALSYMGPGALPPLRDALTSDDAIVRREALRSIGKLKDRASLDLGVVLPLLTDRMTDVDQGVRTVAATYLGIIHEGADVAVPALVKGLADSDPEVRRASAAALGSFGAEALPALEALKKAASDKSDDVAREAGRSVVKLQQK
jgi:HEAT repeat protein